MAENHSLTRAIAFNSAYGYIDPYKEEKRHRTAIHYMNLLKFFAYIPVINFIAASILLHIVKQNSHQENYQAKCTSQAMLSRAIISFIPGVSLLLALVDLITHAVARPILNHQLKKAGLDTFPKILSL